MFQVPNIQVNEIAANFTLAPCGVSEGDVGEWSEGEVG